MKKKDGSRRASYAPERVNVHTCKCKIFEECRENFRQIEIHLWNILRVICPG